MRFLVKKTAELHRYIHNLLVGGQDKMSNISYAPTMFNSKLDIISNMYVSI